MRFNHEVARKFSAKFFCGYRANPIASSSRTALFCCRLIKTGFDSPGLRLGTSSRLPCERYSARRMLGEAEGAVALSWRVRDPAESAAFKKSTVNPHRCCLCFGASVRSLEVRVLSSQHVENDHPCSLSLRRLRNPSFDPERTHIDLACRNIWSTRSDELRRVAEVSSISGAKNRNERRTAWQRKPIRNPSP